MNNPNKATLITCNNILAHLCISARNIARVKVITNKTNPTPSEIEQCLNNCLDYLSANQLIIKTSALGYKITDNGKVFYKNGGFKV